MKLYKLAGLMTAVAAVLAAATLASSPVQAGGVLDPLDKCIEARKVFAEQRATAFNNLRAAEEAVDTLTPPPEFKELWLMDARKRSLPTFKEKVAPKLQKMGLTDMEQAFAAWFEMELAELKPADLEKLITSDYRAISKEELLDAHKEVTLEFEKPQKELDSTCKMDVGNQALRFALTPFEQVAGALEAAKREKNILAQGFRLITQVSLQSMAEQGILGGDRSDLRKLAEPLIGGRNGAIQKGAGDVVRAGKRLLGIK